LILIIHSVESVPFFSENNNKTKHVFIYQMHCSIDQKHCSNAVISNPCIKFIILTPPQTGRCVHKGRPALMSVMSLYWIVWIVSVTEFAYLTQPAFSKLAKFRLISNFYFKKKSFALSVNFFQIFQK